MSHIHALLLKSSWIWRIRICCVASISMQGLRRSASSSASSIRSLFCCVIALEHFHGRRHRSPRHRLHFGLLWILTFISKLTTSVRPSVRRRIVYGRFTRIALVLSLSTEMRSTLRSLAKSSCSSVSSASLRQRQRWQKRCLLWFLGYWRNRKIGSIYRRLSNCLLSFCRILIEHSLHV